MPALPVLSLLAAALAAQVTSIDPDPAPNRPSQPAPTTPAQPTTPPSQTPPSPTTTAPAPKPEFPKTIQKKLWATTDLRGKKAPEIKAEAWLTTLPKTEGKVVLVDFWATWCPPCRALIPELNHWQKDFKDDLVVIGISDEPAPKVEKFMNSAKVEYAMAVDTRPEQVKKSLGIAGIPHVLVIDSTGTVRWQGFPQSEEESLTTEVLRSIIAADKAQRKPAGATTTTPADKAPKPGPSGVPSATPQEPASKPEPRR